MRNLKLFENFNMNEDWGSSDQTAMNNMIHKELGEPKDMPSPTDDKFKSAAESAVDFYWDEWPEYKTQREDLVIKAMKSYMRSKFPDTFKHFMKMFESDKEPAEYEAADDITVRGLFGDFKLKKGDKIIVQDGKMPKNYTVKMPKGVTEINKASIDELIASGKLQQPVVSEDVNEDGAATPTVNNRKEAKKLSASFIKLQDELQATYDKMRSTYREIDYLITTLRKENDFEAADALQKAYGSVDGNLLFSVKDAFKWLVGNSDADAIASLGTPKKAKILKVVPGLDLDEEDFNIVINYCLSKFKNYNFIEYKTNYGIGLGQSSNISGWSTDNSESAIRYAMSRWMQATYNMDDKTLESLNKKLMKTGVVVHKSHKEYKYIQFTKA